VATARTYIGRCPPGIEVRDLASDSLPAVSGTEEEDGSPLERDEIELPDGRRLILYSSRDE
jgi:hypothetical protein